MTEHVSKNVHIRQKNAESSAGIFRPEEVRAATVKLAARSGELAHHVDEEFKDVPEVDEQQAAQEIKKRIDELRAFLQQH